MKFNLRLIPLALLAISLVSTQAHACEICDEDAEPPTKLATTAASESTGQIKRLGTVEVIGAHSSSLPTQIPTTIESVTAKEIAEKINAFDSEDALKYFPSLLVRKRYVGDYDHAVLATRAFTRVRRRHSAFELAR
jgi:hypothetical protein